MVVSVTRLRLRSARFLPGFFFHSWTSRNELVKAAGFLDGRLIADRNQAYWTITRWVSEAEMRAWRGAGAHGVAMRKLAGWCDEASVVRWDEGGEEFPAWETCYRKMKESGRLSPVDQPSADQSARVIPEPDYGSARRSVWFRRSG